MEFYTNACVICKWVMNIFFVELGHNQMKSYLGLALVIGRSATRTCVSSAESENTNNLYLINN